MSLPRKREMPRVWSCIGLVGLPFRHRARARGRWRSDRGRPVPKTGSSVRTSSTPSMRHGPATSARPPPASLTGMPGPARPGADQIPVLADGGVTGELGDVFADARHGAAMRVLDVEIERTSNRVLRVGNVLESGLDTLNGVAAQLVDVLIEETVAEDAERRPGCARASARSDCRSRRRRCRHHPRAMSRRRPSSRRRWSVP